MVAHGLFNFIRKVVFTEPLICPKNWPRTVLVRTSVFFLIKVGFEGNLLTDHVFVVSAETFSLGRQSDSLAQTIRVFLIVLAGCNGYR